MKQPRAIQKSEYNFESTGYDSCVSLAGVWVTFSVLVALRQWYLTLMTATSCRVDISLSSNKYSIILTYCLTVTEYKYIPYKLNTILPDSRKTVGYDSRLQRCAFRSTSDAVCTTCFNSEENLSFDHKILKSIELFWQKRGNIFLNTRDADKSLARHTSRCRRTESIVSLDRGGLLMCRIASLFLLQRLKGSMSGDAHDFNNTKMWAVIKFFSCKARRRRKFTQFWQKH